MGQEDDKGEARSQSPKEWGIHRLTTLETTHVSPQHPIQAATGNKTLASFGHQVSRDAKRPADVQTGRIGWQPYTRTDSLKLKRDVEAKRHGTWPRRQRRWKQCNHRRQAPYRGNNFRQQPTQKSGNEGPSAHKTVSVTWGETYVTTT